MMGIWLEERFHDNHTVCLTLNRPAVLNALNSEMGRQLNSALDRLGYDPSVRALIITGSGRAFSTGGERT